MISAGSAVMWFCIQIILALGIERKSVFQIFADILGGGTAGAVMGLLFFLIFGAVGWVSGALYGALGLLSLMIGGALGGLGLGALIHIARNPGQYNYNLPVILVGIIVTYLYVQWTSLKVGKLYDEYGPLLVQWFRSKLDK